MEEKKVVFVCTGNTCRSPMAEAILRSELKRLDIRDVAVLSAGTHASETSFINAKSAAVLSENGLSLDNFNSRRLDAALLKDAYAIVCMTDALRDILMDMRWSVLRKEGFSDIENNVWSFSDLAGYEIPDPFGRDEECYRQTYRKLAEGMPVLIEKLALKPLPQPAVKTAAGKKEGAEPAAVRKRKPRAKPRKRRTPAGGVSSKAKPARAQKPKKKAAGKGRQTSGKTAVPKEAGKKDREQDKKGEEQ